MSKSPHLSPPPVGASSAGAPPALRAVASRGDTPRGGARITAQGRLNAWRDAVAMRWIAAQQYESKNEIAESRDALETREAELVVAIFRTLVLVAVLIGPHVLGLPVSYERGEIWLAAIAGIYNIVTALGCLLPSRYGLRRPFITAMDLLLVTLWIQLSGQWELRTFYYVIVVVAAMWFRVLGGIVTATFCNFFFLYLWFRMAGDPQIANPPTFNTPLILNTAMLFLVGALVGYIAEAQERERERRLEDQLLIANYQREIDLSSQLQPSLVAPQLLNQNELGTSENDAYLDIGAAMQSARTLGGGDFCDVIPLGNGLTGICIADVSGKSVRAQARLPLLKYSLRALAPLYSQPEKLVARLNQTLAPDLQPELYIAFCYIVLDPKKRTLSWCNAGHIAPLLLSARDENKTTLLKTHGPALGMFGEAEYAHGTHEWQPTDCLLLYTDGLTDAFSYRGSEDGEAQLKKLARAIVQSGQCAHQDAGNLLALATAILDDNGPLERAHSVLNRTGFKYDESEESKIHRDDITVVVARCMGAS